MDLKFSEMSVDTTLAQRYIKKNELLLKLYTDYNGTIEKNKNKNDFYDILNYNRGLGVNHKDEKAKFKDLASKLKQNANLIAQLEYHIRNIPIEETHAQLNLLIQYFSSSNSVPKSGLDMVCLPDDPLVVLAYGIALTMSNVVVKSKALVAICNLLVTLQCEAGIVYVKALQLFKETEGISTEDTTNAFDTENRPRRPDIGLNSGTVAVVSDDADVDSAVDKFISVSIQAPWRLRRILVQESVYQEFKEALTWKCTLNKSGSKAPTRNVLCSDTLTYNDRTFLIDPVELIQEQPSLVTVEAYRTTKEMISLVEQYNTHYLSLWINGVAEINEVTHSTTAPVVWVNTVADFRGPFQVTHAVFSYRREAEDTKYYEIKKCAKVAKLCELSQSWLKLDFESRRDILCDVLDEYLLMTNDELYTKIKHSISSCTQKSFVDVGKDYVCIGILKPKGIMITKYKHDFFSAKGFESILQGNALIIIGGTSPYYSVLELKGVPVVNINDVGHDGDLKVPFWNSSCFMPTRVIWTNSGTIFAN